MARPSRNGVAERKVKTPRDLKPLVNDSKPIGRVPNGFDAGEKEMWNAIIKECPWVDMSHRRWVIVLARAAARAECIADYFRQRKAEFAKQGIPVALAYLDDETGKRHQLMTDLLAADEGVRKSLSALGASPASQVKMMSGIGDSKTNAKLDERRQSYFQ